MNYRKEQFVAKIRLRLITLIVALSVGLGIATVAVPALPAGATQGGILVAGEILAAGQSVTSPNGGFTLAMQPDGNLVVYLDPAVYGGQVPISASNSGGHPSAAYYAAMQGDGNLVVYAPGGHALWSSKTGGRPLAAYEAKMQNDGNLVIYNGAQVIWQSGTYGSTKTSTECPPSQGPFGGVNVCFSTSVWHNGQHAGVLSLSALTAQCVPYGLTNRYCTGTPTKATRITGGAHNISALDQIVVQPYLLHLNIEYCFQLRIDTDLNGNSVSADLPTVEAFGFSSC